VTKHTDIYNVTDIKDTKGFWRKSYRPEPFVQCHTRAGKVWDGLQYRCKKGGSYGTGTYAGCSVNFQSFHEFADWCQGEFGYRNKNTNNTFWPIDKDLIKPKSLYYGPDNCMFVPQKVNSCFTLRQNNRGLYPIGVIFHKRDLIFEATCNDGTGKGIYLGRFDDPMLAHMAWVGKKIDVMQAFTRDVELLGHDKLVKALESKIERYSNCIRLGIQVKY